MGGIIGGTALAKACGLSNVITLDMGGTSADISPIAEGTPVLTNRSHVGPYPLLVQMLDIITIGAGGAAMALLVYYEVLRGVTSTAGATPGPVFSGLGSRAATVHAGNLTAGRPHPV